MQSAVDFRMIANVWKRCVRVDLVDISNVSLMRHSEKFIA